MAIGTLAAIGIGLAGAGAVASGISQNKAASKAAQATQYAADQSAQVLRENYDKSAEALAPWQNSGLRANNAIDALLGLGGTVPQQGLPTARPTQAVPYNDGGMGGVLGKAIGLTRAGRGFDGPEIMQSVGWDGQPNPPGMMSLGGGGNDPFAAYVQANPDVAAEFNRVGSNFANQADFGRFHWNTYGQNEGRAAPNALVAAMNPQQAQNSAFDNFRNSTGYQFRLGEGMNALNSGFAGAGSIKSGAAMKEAMKYGQNFASNEFANYFNMLNGQAGKGLSAASAQAGVSQNLGNNLANIQMQQGENLANAALSKTNPLANGLSMLGGGAMKFGK